MRAREGERERARESERERERAGESERERAYEGRYSQNGVEGACTVHLLVTQRSVGCASWSSKSLNWRLGMGVGAKWKWTFFSLFVIGVNDVVSDFTTLALIPTQNPFFLFHVSLASLGCSVTASLVLSFCSSIKVQSVKLSWQTRTFIFITGEPEKWNSRVLLCVENLPQLVVEAILLYLQGSQGFTGWIGQFWFRPWSSPILNIVIRIRELGKDLRGKREVTDQAIGVDSASLQMATATV